MGSAKASPCPVPRPGETDAACQGPITLGRAAPAAFAPSRHRPGLASSLNQDLWPSHWMATRNPPPCLLALGPSLQLLEGLSWGSAPDQGSPGWIPNPEQPGPCWELTQQGGKRLSWKGMCCCWKSSRLSLAPYGAASFSHPISTCLGDTWAHQWPSTLGWLPPPSPKGVPCKGGGETLTCTAGWGVPAPGMLHMC